MALMRVLLGTVVAGGQDYGPGAAVEVPDDEAAALERAGVAAFEGRDGAAPAAAADGERRDDRSGAETGDEAGDETGDPTEA